MGRDNATLFYTVLDSAKRPYKVYRHRLGDRSRALPAMSRIFHRPTSASTWKCRKLRAAPIF